MGDQERVGRAGKRWEMEPFAGLGQGRSGQRQWQGMRLATRLLQWTGLRLPCWAVQEKGGIIADRSSSPAAFGGARGSPQYPMRW